MTVYNPFEMKADTVTAETKLLSLIHEVISVVVEFSSAVNVN